MSGPTNFSRCLLFLIIKIVVCQVPVRIAVLISWKGESDDQGGWYEFPYLNPLSGWLMILDSIDINMIPNFLGGNCWGGMICE